MIATIQRLVKRRIQNWINELWVPRVGDRVQFAKAAKTNHFQHDAYDPQVGDQGVITSIYRNFNHSDGYIIALDNGCRVNYEFPYHGTLDLIYATNKRKRML